jgi:hypothetical protein
MFHPLEIVLIRNEWKNSDVPGPFNGFGKQSLMSGADSTDPSGQYFPPFGDKMTEKFSVFEIDIGYFFGAEFAYSLASNTEPFWTWHNSLAFLLLGIGKERIRSL